MKKNLIIVGGGSSAHALIAFLDGSDFNVSLLTSKPEKWANTIELQYQEPNGRLIKKIHGKLQKASDNPNELIPHADYIVLCMPVSQYRIALHNISSHINREKKIFMGSIYGQGGFNWMIDEVKKQYSLENIISFSYGLIPWICRTIEYGKIGVTYGSKAVNIAAVYPKKYFNQINNELFDNICYKWFNKGEVLQADNFLSLTLSADNQIIHTSRCFGLYKRYGPTWNKESDVPMFYKHFDDISAKILAELDEDYSKIRYKIKLMFPDKVFKYMLDYLSLERLSYQSENTDIKESFINSKTLVAIKTPTVQNKEGLFEIDKSHRFFCDDIYYGNCIAKWMAELLNIEVPTIDIILDWAQNIRNEKIIDKNNKLMSDSPDLNYKFKTGIPTVYGFNSIEDIID